MREASTRPLEASAGVPEHGDRQRPEGAPAGEPSAGPEWEEAGAAAPMVKPAEGATPAPVKIIEAPEAMPVSEMKPALTPSEVKPVLPDEKGVVVLEREAGVEWGAEEKAPPKEGAAGMAAGAGPVPPIGAGPAGAPEGAPAIAGEQPGLPVHPPLPQQFAGTGRDIRMFIQNGTFMFLAGSVVYFLVALDMLGLTLLSAPDGWDYQRAADSGVAGLLVLGLSAGAFACMLLSRYRLEEPLRRNDVGMVRRRLPVAAGAGLLFGLVLGGLLLYLAHVKVGELPFPARAGDDDAPEAENA